MSPNWPKRLVTKVTAVLDHGFPWSHNEKFVIKAIVFLRIFFTANGIWKPEAGLNRSRFTVDGAMQWGKPILQTICPQKEYEIPPTPPASPLSSSLPFSPLSLSLHTKCIKILSNFRAPPFLLPSPSS